MLGNIVISMETSARQAEERGHTLPDEIRILLVGFIISMPKFIIPLDIISLLVQSCLIHICVTLV